MCRARFQNGLPMTDAFVIMQSKKRGKPIVPPPLTFIMDTGADATILNPIDSVKLGIQYQKDTSGMHIPHLNRRPLKQGASFGGIKARLQGFELPNVTLVFITNLGNNNYELHEEQLDILYIPEGNVPLSHNLLGRDLLSRFDIIWKSSENIIDFTRVYRPGKWTVRVV